MPLIDITMNDTLSQQEKGNLRYALCRDMAALVGVDPKFIAVLFRELPEADLGPNGSFTEVYLSEGRPDDFKEKLAKFVAEDISGCTGWPSDRANVIIHDLRHGSVAAGGKILNRMSTAAEAVIKKCNTNS